MDKEIGGLLCLINLVIPYVQLTPWRNTLTKTHPMQKQSTAAQKDDCYH